MKTEKEQWRPVNLDGWGKYYECSNLGRVRNAKYYRPKADKEYCQYMGYIPKPGDFRKPVLNKVTGYMQIMLIHNKELKLIRLGRLIALTWVPKEGEEQCQVKYKNDQCLDDRACNLYWATSGGRRNTFDYKLVEKLKKMKKKMKLTDICKKTGLPLGKVVYLLYSSKPATTPMQRLR
jgi:hypothetical protein